MTKKPNQKVSLILFVVQSVLVVGLISTTVSLVMRSQYIRNLGHYATGVSENMYQRLNNSYIINLEKDAFYLNKKHPSEKEIMTALEAIYDDEAIFYEKFLVFEGESDPLREERPKLRELHLWRGYKCTLDERALQNQEINLQEKSYTEIITIATEASLAFVTLEYKTDPPPLFEASKPVPTELVCRGYKFRKRGQEVSLFQARQKLYKARSFF